MKRYSRVWMAISVLALAALACQSQELISAPVVEGEPSTKAQFVQIIAAGETPTSPEHTPVETTTLNPIPVEISAAEVSSLEMHEVLGYGIGIEPTISPDTGQNAAELLQLGTQPLADAFNPPAGCDAATDADVEAAILKYINDERARYGLSPLVMQYQLAAAADVHTLDMACSNFFSHTGSNGSSPFDRIKSQGYAYAYAGENLFAGGGVYNDAGQAVSAWMNSAGHRENILNANFTEAGVSYTFNAGSKYGGYFAIVFARP